MPDTETIDRLYLEWSQFTLAKTERELIAESALTEIARTHAEHPSGSLEDYANFCITRALEALEKLRIGQRMFEKRSVTVSGEEANLLLFALDQYLETDYNGEVLQRKGGYELEELQTLRNRLFAAHKHKED